MLCVRAVGSCDYMSILVIYRICQREGNCYTKKAFPSRSSPPQVWILFSLHYCCTAGRKLISACLASVKAFSSLFTAGKDSSKQSLLLWLMYRFVMFCSEKQFLWVKTLICHFFSWLKNKMCYYNYHSYELVCSSMWEQTKVWSFVGRCVMWCLTGVSTCVCARMCVCVEQAVTVGRQITAAEQNRGDSQLFTAEEKTGLSVEGG